MVTVGAAVIVHRFALDRITGVQGIASGPLRACTDCDVTSGCASGARATFAAGARVQAHEIDTRPIVGAFIVGEALPALAARQGVTDIAGGTGAHRPLLPGIVVARRANRVGAAGIRFAEIAWFEQSATDERIAGHMFRATANGSDAA